MNILELKLQRAETKKTKVFKPEVDNMLLDVSNIKPECACLAEEELQIEYKAAVQEMTRTYLISNIGKVPLFPGDMRIFLRGEDCCVGG